MAPTYPPITGPQSNSPKNATVIAYASVGSNMAETIAVCQARKIQIPLSQENTAVVGVSNRPLPKLVQELIEKHLEEQNP